MAMINNLGHVQNVIAKNSQTTTSESKNSTQGGFLDVVKQIGQEAIESSHKADYAMSQQGARELTEIQRAQLLLNVNAAAEEGKSVVEACKKTMDSILSTPL